MKIESKLLLEPKSIKPSFNDWKVEGVFNPGAIRLPNNKIILYARIAESVIIKRNGHDVFPMVVSDRPNGVKYERISSRKVLDRGRNVIYYKDDIARLTTISHLRRVFLDESGMNVEKVENIPAFVGEPHDGEFGVEDPRITKIGNMYLMTYTSVSLNEGVCTSLAISKNLKNWKRRGIIFRQQNKDTVIFPEKINGLYVALHRPEGNISFSKKSIWISYSPDLVFWGKEKSILFSRPESWGEAWVGAGTPPIKTKKGWLFFYHGVKVNKNKKIYSVGAALLDLNNPEKVIARTRKNKPLIIPSETYEKSGFINGVVFPTGAILSLDKKYILLYCGAADRSICVKKLSLDGVLNSLEKF